MTGCVGYCPKGTVQNCVMSNVSSGSLLRSPASSAYTAELPPEALTVTTRVSGKPFSESSRYKQTALNGLRSSGSRNTTFKSRMLPSVNSAEIVGFASRRIAPLLLVIGVGRSENLPPIIVKSSRQYAAFSKIHSRRFTLSVSTPFQVNLLVRQYFAALAISAALTWFAPISLPAPIVSSVSSA